MKRIRLRCLALLGLQKSLDSYLQGAGRMCLNSKYFLATGYSRGNRNWDAPVPILVKAVAIYVVVNFQHHRVGVWCLLRFESVDAL